MLEPEVFDYILDSLGVHKQLQESILRDIARRIVKNGVSPADALTETTVYQARMLQSAGVVYNDAVKIIADYSNAINYDIQTAFDAAEVEIFNYDDEVILSNGYEPKAVKNLSPAMKQIWEAALSKTFTEANNLTKTIAITSQNAFISACDLAHMQIASGSFTYQQAIANAVKQASQQSMRVLYPSGSTASTDYAIRRAVLTSINQSAGQIMSMRATELNHDLMQTTAHYGARPEHAEWQGQVVSMSGADGYLSAADIGYGSVTGIFGANCNHSWYMYFGHPAYTPEQLRDMKDKTVTYNGQEMSVYDARRKQRGYERTIKKTKAELVAYDEALKRLPLEEQTALKFQFQNASVKLKGQEAKLSDFCRQTGLKRDKFREQMFAAETEDAIKAWSKSASSKAVWATRKTLSSISNNHLKISENDDIIKLSGMYRRTLNTGAFSHLPERMSKKHIRQLAKEYGIDLKGITLSIDTNEDLLRVQIAGDADPDNIGHIIFLPNAFKSKEELLRTIYHEKYHVEQYKKYGSKHVQSNRQIFEDEALLAENTFINNLKERGLI